MRMIMVAAAAFLISGLGGCGSSDELPIPDGLVLLTTASADLDRDGAADTVRLLGRADDPDSPFRDHLTLMMATAPRLWLLPSEASAAYEPRLALVDVTGDGRPEAIVTGSSGGSGGMVIAAVVMIVPHGDRWRFRNVYDTATGPWPELGGELVAGQSAELVVRAPGLEPQRQTLDLAGRYAGLGDQGPYDETGELREPVALWGEGLMAVEPVRLANGRPALRVVQQVRGVSNADRLATVATTLVWEKAAWTAHEVQIEPLT
jgi:hypothetical protein